MSRYEHDIQIPGLGDVSVSGIVNRNEQRVLEALVPILEEFPDFSPSLIDIQDIYALSLNLLPARYTQEFSIVLREPVSEGEVWEAVRSAVRRVMHQPTAGDR